jgi:uncharacterized protein YfaS (alpha-2-macroglobulin family)
LISQLNWWSILHWGFFKNGAMHRQPSHLPNRDPIFPAERLNPGRRIPPMTDGQKQLFSTKRIILLVFTFFLFFAAGVMLVVYLIGRSSPPGPGVTTPAPIPVATGTTMLTPGISGGEYGISPRLSEGSSQTQTVQPLPVATGEPLPPEEVEQILVLLPVLSPAPEEQVEFNLPTEPLAPPRPGETVKEVFPPAEMSPTPDVVPSGPLQVLRFAPEGEIPIAPFVSITFNQPMVPLGTLEDLAAEDVPVQIEPFMPGTWRWLGTKTLTFEYDSEQIDRLPKATEYRVTVPAGTKSATGGVLTEPVTWTFTTPPPKAITTWPYDSPQPLEPLFFVGFDQRIDPPAVLDTIHLIAGSRSMRLVMATEADIKKDEQISRMSKDFAEGRWLAFRAAEPFPTDTDITVTIGPGTPSVEGPLLTTEAQTFSFRTYAALRIEEHGCSSYSENCPPLTPFYIRFNNPIDAQAYAESMLRVEPEIPGVVVNIYGNSLGISGQTKGQTTYTVTVDGDIQDIFGQKLGTDARLTFKVGSAEPVLVAPGEIFLTLDPAASKPVFSVYAVNYETLNLKIYSVQPSDWLGFTEYLREWRQTDKPPSMPGTLVSDKVLRLNLPADALTQVDIGLSDYLRGDSGQFVVVVEPPKGFIETENDKWRRYSQTIIRWIQITQIGLDAFTDHSDMVVWATDLKDGTPLAGVDIRPEGGVSGNYTGTDGIAQFVIPSGASYLVASKGADTAILTRSAYWYNNPWTANPPNDSLRWYVFDDRKMYKPGEEVHIKGWVRRIGGRQNGDVGLAGTAVDSVFYQITDPQGNALGDGRAELTALGGFDFAFTLPQAVNLGDAQLTLTAQGGTGGLDGLEYSHNFQIQEFRRPEFEVGARSETTGPYFAGEHAILAVEAKYYAGGALPNADTTWQVTTSPASYSPPNWPDFSFGTWQPWWWYYDAGYPDGSEGGASVTYTGKTDAEGIHLLRLDFDRQGDPGTDPRPFSIAAQATVMDVNRQAWSSTTSLLVHPADLYVGLRSERYFVARGTPLKVDVIVTDLDGNAVADRSIEVQAARLEWKIRGGDWREEEADVQTCALRSTLEPLSCTFETPIGGTYQITAVVTDTLGRKNQSRFTRWVSGGQQPPSRKVEQEEVTLIPDKQTYQPGDVAQILVQSPFGPAEGLLTVSRSGILYTQRFRMQGGDVTLSIPIEDKHIPNLNIQVDLTGSAPRTDDQGNALPDVPARPAYATGRLNLSIPPLQRTLALQVTPEEQMLEPGSDTTLNVVLKDAAGQPVRDAELAVVVVDEAILALTNYDLADPIGIFYADRPSLVASVYGRTSIVLADPQALARTAASQNEMMDGMGGGGEPAPTQAAVAPSGALSDLEESKSATGQDSIFLRSDFNPLAAFIPAVRTDFNGEARVPVHLPDNLTRYRVMVVAVDSQGRMFGTGESNLTARLPLMVRPSAPRFLNFGDKFELPVVLQNQTGSPLIVDVAVRASNLEFAGGAAGAGLRVTVPANDRVEVRFPASTKMAGTARMQIAAVSGSYVDAATVELPVYTPATTEAFATYGVIDEGSIAQPVLAPSGVFPQYGGLEVGTSSTALQALTDAVLYLQSYPFECSEQLSSRILAVASLRDVLTAFHAEGLPSPQEMESAVERDISRLQGLQNSDGGFPYWRRGFESIPFNTIHAAHALYRAQQKGFDVPAEMLQSALRYLQQIENYYPSWYDSQTRWTLSAYALFVRNLTGDRDSQKAQNLLQEAGLENLSLEAIGWLWPVIDDNSQLIAIRRYVNNHVVETAGAANFTTYYSDQTYLLLSSDRRTDAILLDALIEDNPQSDLIPKVVNGLLAHRTKGRWGNTQENVFVLLALDRYFNTYEAQTPDFVASLWLGDTYAGSSEFQGRTTERHETVIPMSYVLSETAAGGGTSDLILSKEGPGRLYYRLGLRYAPTDLNLQPMDMGFVVRRRYEAVDDPDDVTRDANGVWHIKAGARVRVRIDMVATNRRYHVALVDPLPAGLEIVNPALAVSGSIPQDPQSSDYRYGWWWWGTWFEHQNLRDERAEAFTSLLWDGVYEYTYVARATTPGTFIVPPAKAEEMYSPEVFGRSGSDWVIVE